MFTKAALTLTALTLATASFAMSDADANADKMLSMDEMKAAYPEINENQFTLADANGDGMLTEQELKDAVEAGVLPDLGG
jgi:Ca2+-binding EF-hand superfamily protein